MIARERADCNETERMDKKNWSKLDYVNVSVGIYIQH